MAVIISGKELATKKKNEMALKVQDYLKVYGRAPHLAVILVGEDPGSVSYVKGKEKACQEIGIINTTIRKDATITEEQMLEMINTLNADDRIDGI